MIFDSDPVIICNRRGARNIFPDTYAANIPRYSKAISISQLTRAASVRVHCMGGLESLRDVGLLSAREGEGNIFLDTNAEVIPRYSISISQLTRGVSLSVRVD